MADQRGRSDGHGSGASERGRTGNEYQGEDNLSETERAVHDVPFEKIEIKP